MVRRFRGEAASGSRFNPRKQAPTLASEECPGACVAFWDVKRYISVAHYWSKLSACRSFFEQRIASVVERSRSFTRDDLSPTFH
jgi:hypothetical protein